MTENEKQKIRTQMDDLDKQLTNIHRQIQTIANIEASAVWGNGFGARGELEPIREDCIRKSAAIIEQMEKLHKQLVGD